MPLGTQQPLLPLLLQKVAAATARSKDTMGTPSLTDSTRAA